VAEYHETIDAAVIAARRVEKAIPAVEGNEDFLRMRRALAQVLLLTWDWECGRGEFGSSGQEARLAKECGDAVRAVALRELSGEG